MRHRFAKNSNTLDWSGIEPETFRMRSERDTPTPPALMDSLGLPSYLLGPVLLYFKLVNMYLVGAMNICC